MHVKLYEDIARHGHIATTYAYPVKVEGRYVMDPSPTPKFDNPKMHLSPALQLFGAGREKRIYAVPPYTEVRQPRLRGPSVRGADNSTSPARCAAPRTSISTRSCSTTAAAACSSAPTPTIARRGAATAIAATCRLPPQRPDGALRAPGMTDEPPLPASAGPQQILRRARRLRRVSASTSGRARCWPSSANPAPARSTLLDCSVDAAGADLGRGLLPHARRRVPRPLRA